MSDYKLPPEEEKVMKEVTDQATTSTLPEAPASASVKIKSARGFEYIFTLRDEHASTLMFKLNAMEQKWEQLGWTPVAQNQPYKRSSEDAPVPVKTTQASAPPAPKIHATDAPGEVLQCQICGYPMIYKEGVTKGKKWKAWMCSTGNRSHPVTWL